MMNEKDFIGLYKEIARLTEAMLSVAHQNDWDTLTMLEADCAKCVEKIKACNPAKALSPDASKKKAALLKTILNNDREIRHLTQPLMGKRNKLPGGAHETVKALMNRR